MSFENMRNIPHALLFEGAESGEREAAFELASRILCSSEGMRPCSRCIHCAKAKALSHPDLFILSPNDKAHIVLPQIREALGKVRLRPFEAAGQVVVIEEAHRMNEEAQNAFLKVLEEPPAGVHFILLTAEPLALLPTVRSRCQTIRFTTTPGVVVKDKREGGLDEIFALLKNAHSGEVTVFPDRSKTSQEEALSELDLWEAVLRDLWVYKATGDDSRLSLQERRREIRDAAVRFSIEAAEEALSAAGKAREDVEHFLSVKLVFLDFWSRLGLRFYR